MQASDRGRGLGRRWLMRLPPRAEAPPWGGDGEQVPYCLRPRLGRAGSEAWLVKSTHAYHALMSVVLLPLWMASGSMFPAPSGGVITTIMTVNPMTYAVEGLRHALHGGADCPAGGLAEPILGIADLPHA